MSTYCNKGLIWRLFNAEIFRINSILGWLISSLIFRISLPHHNQHIIKKILSLCGAHSADCCQTLLNVRKTYKNNRGGMLGSFVNISDSLTRALSNRICYYRTVLWSLNPPSTPLSLSTYANEIWSFASNLLISKLYAMYRLTNNLNSMYTFKRENKNIGADLVWKWFEPRANTSCKLGLRRASRIQWMKTHTNIDPNLFLRIFARFSLFPLGQIKSKHCEVYRYSIYGKESKNVFCVYQHENCRAKRQMALKTND